MTRTSHGVLPNPAPAVVELLRNAPTYGRDIAVELTTPTGAALLAALGVGWGPLPAMTGRATGFGAGTRELDGLPNAVQVVIGSASPAEAGSSPWSTSRAAGRAARGQPGRRHRRGAGPRRGRPARRRRPRRLDHADRHEEGAAGPRDQRPRRPGSRPTEMAALLMAETGSLGVRGQTLHRWLARRRFDEVEVDGYPVRVKVSPGRVKAEYSDAARVARRLEIPLREVTARAEGEMRLRVVDSDEGDGHDPTTKPRGEAG